MRNVDLIYQAKTKLVGNMKQILPVFIFIGILQMIPSNIGNEFVYIVLMILFCPASQGYITSSLKLYHDQIEEIQTYDDGLYGMRKWPQLFSTYLTYNLTRGFLLLGVSIIYFVVYIFIVGNKWVQLIDLFNQFSVSIIDSMQEEALVMQMLPLVLSLVIPLLIILAIVGVLYYLNFFPTFYLLEDQGLKGREALEQAKVLMKGNKKQLLMLQIHYLGKRILSFIICIFITIGFNLMIDDLYLMTLCATIVLAISDACIYKVELQTSLTLFYKTVLVPEVFDTSNDFDDQDVEVIIPEVIDQPRKDDFIERQDQTLSDEDEGFFEKFGRKEILLGFLVYLPIYFVFGQYIISFLFKILLNFTGWRDMNVINAWYNFVFDGVLGILGILLFPKVFQGAYNYFTKLDPKRVLKMTLAGYGLIYVVSTVTSILVELVQSGGESANQAGIETIMNVCPVPMILAVVVCAPIVEELIFRGIIFRSFRKINVYLALFVSSFAFGFIHISSYVLSGDMSQWIQMLPYMAMGLVFGLAYEKSKSISIPMYLHFINNLISVIAIMFIK